MLERAARELGIDLAEAVSIGDRLSDIQAGAAVGTATVLVPSDVDEPAARALADFLAVDLLDAVRWLVEGWTSATLDAVRSNPSAVAYPRFVRKRMDCFSGQGDAKGRSKKDDGRSRTRSHASPNPRCVSSSCAACAGVFCGCCGRRAGVFSSRAEAIHGDCFAAFQQHAVEPAGR